MSANDMIDDDSFLFSNEAEELETEVSPEPSHVWRILIVDDEPEIHKVSELALANLNVLDRKLEFLHAFSGEEAIKVLQEESDIAVILLDVVMESDHAGLEVVEKVRTELNLNDVRIILRTGQPGYAPEETVVIEYDINDYKTKTELTRSKLLTSLYSAVRSYHQLIQIGRSKDFLTELNELSGSLISQATLHDFMRTLTNGAVSLFHAEPNQHHFVLMDSYTAPVKGLSLMHSSELPLDANGKLYEQVLSGEEINLTCNVHKRQENYLDDSKLILYIDAHSCKAILYLTLDNLTILPSAELITAFTSNVASALDNSMLLKRVSDVAYLDTLTGLPNRARFIQLLDEYAKGKSSADTVVLLDIDHFSDINDGLGQDVGNSLLVSIANRLVNELDSSIHVSRLGADIYGLIGDTTSLDTDKILSLFNNSFQADEHHIPLNANLGISRKFNNEKSGMAVLKHTNIALNKAKKDIHNRFKVYQPEMEDETSWRLGMIRRLTSDFRDNKLQVWYQPQVSMKTKEVIGFEALLRWPDGQGGFISPVTFIPLAEYSGLIVDIGAWVVERSCIDMQHLKSLSHNDLRVAVNVSMPQFRHTGFVDKVIELTSSHNMAPSNFELEITESVVMDDPKLVITALERLQQHGFQIAIDDFGTGFSSLSYLQSLPINRIKVDREFVKDIGEGGDGIIAEAVIHLGKKLGLETIAEGIETETQSNYIEQLGCDEGQGYLYAKPMPRDELIKFLDSYKP